ncbi:hypothetical protein DE146DRAFT_674392 [Phaeosphaeria sp. MPI-PUGE-AT-0046c]|nr:hypothetical protein DE146DRAFT_674392 [Phaeosphaeria sp. MPI-PUGE-AT-0046c]
MATREEFALAASNPTIRTHVEAALKRKLQRIPEHILLSLTIEDLLCGNPQALANPNVPKDIQLPFVLRNRPAIDRNAGRPIKNENQQNLDTTRAIFFYHLHEAYQFQRYHDTSRWNLAFFSALLCNNSATPTSANPDHSNDSDESGVYAQFFMISYLAAVMERHNTPTTFDKRESFVRCWKKSDWDLFTRFAAGQKKLLKREMSRLSKEWEIESDRAIRYMSRDEYNLRVAPFVGSVVPGRKDQGLMREQGHLCGLTNRPGSQPSEPVSLDAPTKMKELIDALCAPVEDERYGEHEDYDEDATTPTDLSDAITWLQMARPVDILPVLLRLFPVEE